MARSQPNLERVLVIESAPREFGERALAALYERGVSSLDLLTCYPSAPNSFDPGRGHILSVHSPEARGSRGRFIASLCDGRYSSVIALSVRSGVLRNWKWAIAPRVLSRLAFLDEDLNLLPLTGHTTRPLRKLAARRINPFPKVHLNLPTAAIAAAGMAALAPFKIAFLLAFTAQVHARRVLRQLTAR